MSIRPLLISSALLLAVGTGIVVANSPGTIIVRDGNAANCTTTPANCGTSKIFAITVDDNGNTHWDYTGTANNLSTLNGAVTITTGGTYQTLLAAPATNRNSLTIQNNQISGTDVCYLLFGSNVAGQVTPGSTTTASNLTIGGNMVPAGLASVILNPGQSYTRYFPLVPADVIYATCSTTGDGLYVDTQ